VLHACEIASRSTLAADVRVATDDRRVRDVVIGAGFPVEMTSGVHVSGTDRVASVARGLDAEIVVGFQADEPFLSPEDLDRLVGALGEEQPASGDRLATLASPLGSRAGWLDPNTVKVVTDTDGRALYFSRAPIPYTREADGGFSFPPAGDPPGGALSHVGVYAWRREALIEFSLLPPSPLERSEGLEQLRALEAGWRIRVIHAVGDPFGVDTPADLERAERRLAGAAGTEDR
jgi:3-deoxy-manno-octulosonate cytidylyltransferase (CMP-KDO synthetase)